jgi:hypothetical protein
MKKCFFVLFAVTFIASCKTNELYLNVIEPAPVTIPSYVHNVGVIDRSPSTEESRPLDVADKILTLEGAGLDRVGAAESIRGLTEELLKNSRFNSVKKLDMDFRSPKISLFPVPLSWEIIADVCREQGIDAIFSLERFDTDTKIGYSNRKVDIKTPLGSIPGP